MLRGDGRGNRKGNMKRIIGLILLATLAAGCTSKTQYGDCIGAFDDKKPGLEYKLSVWNTILAIVFSETIVVPVVVIANQTHCPTGAK